MLPDRFIDHDKPDLQYDEPGLDAPPHHGHGPAGPRARCGPDARARLALRYRHDGRTDSPAGGPCNLDRRSGGEYRPRFADRHRLPLPDGDGLRRQCDGRPARRGRARRRGPRRQYDDLAHAAGHGRAERRGRGRVPCLRRRRSGEGVRRSCARVCGSRSSCSLPCAAGILAFVFLLPLSAMTPPPCAWPRACCSGACRRIPAFARAAFTALRNFVTAARPAAGGDGRHHARRRRHRPFELSLRLWQPRHAEARCPRRRSHGHHRLWLQFLAVAGYVHFDRGFRGSHVFAGLGRTMPPFWEILHVGWPISGAYLFENGLFLIDDHAGRPVRRRRARCPSVIMRPSAPSPSWCRSSIGQAATVRVGRALGAGDHAEARRAGYAALRLGVIWMLMAAPVFVLLPRSSSASTSTSTTRSMRRPRGRLDPAARSPLCSRFSTAPRPWPPAPCAGSRTPACPMAIVLPRLLGHRPQRRRRAGLHLGRPIGARRPSGSARVAAARPGLHRDPADRRASRAPGQARLPPGSSAPTCCWSSAASSRRRAGAQALILAGKVFSGERRIDKPGQLLAGGRAARVARPGPSLGLARRAQAGPCARSFRHRSRRAASRSTSAPRPAASPTCCSRAARPRSMPSMSATASSPGSCARIRASSCSRASMPAI